MLSLEPPYFLYCSNITSCQQLPDTVVRFIQYMSLFSFKVKSSIEVPQNHYHCQLFWYLKLNRGYNVLRAQNKKSILKKKIGIHKFLLKSSFLVLTRGFLILPRTVSQLYLRRQTAYYLNGRAHVQRQARHQEEARIKSMNTCWHAQTCRVTCALAQICMNTRTDVYIEHGNNSDNVVHQQVIP